MLEVLIVMGFPFVLYLSSYKLAARLATRYAIVLPVPTSASQSVTLFRVSPSNIAFDNLICSSRTAYPYFVRTLRNTMSMKSLCGTEYFPKYLRSPVYLMEYKIFGTSAL